VNETSITGVQFNLSGPLDHLFCHNKVFLGRIVVLLRSMTIAKNEIVKATTLKVFKAAQPEVCSA